MPSTASDTDSLDVLIVGAGISGIGAAYYLQRDHPDRSYAILEAREASGGTWDLFRYPGIRSDSDLHTFGYAFKPWRDEEAIAGGGKILGYLRETAAENGIDRHIRFQTKVVAASWSSTDARWTVEVERTDTGELTTLTCAWLFCAAGYYRYDEGFTPQFEGREQFRGEIVHPQHWPQDLDYAGKRVVVIGSGATASPRGPRSSPERPEASASSSPTPWPAAAAPWLSSTGTPTVWRRSPSACVHKAGARPRTSSTSATTRRRTRWAGSSPPITRTPRCWSTTRAWRSAAPSIRSPRRSSTG